MTILDLSHRRPAEPALQDVRDPLASDVDDRLVVRVPVSAEPQPTERLTWPVPRRERHLPAGWPIALAVAGWPVWWALGLTNLVFPLCAIPLAWALVRRRQVRVPPGFWMWALFLLLVAVSVIAINVDVAGAATTHGLGRYFAFGLRLLNYAAITVMLLYVGNMTEAELPRRRVIRWLSTLGVMCIVLGALSLLAPSFGYASPAARLFPGWLQTDGSAVVRLSQMQPVLGDVSPRPAAPFSYTNAWGNVLSLLLVWLVVGWGVLGSRMRRLALFVVLAIALLPIVFSLNRAMWVGIGISIVVVALRLAFRGLVKALIAVVLLVTLTAVAFAASPLGTMVQDRIETGHSNEIRSSLLDTAVEAAAQSPVVGFGTTRTTLGSDRSIAIGPSEACPRCGSRNIGSTGQLTLLLISQGFLGVLLYGGFLIGSLWRYRRDYSVIGIAGTLVILLQVFYAGFYSALTMPLAVTFLSIALLWRNDEMRRAASRS
jgi:hypothetical protein